MFNEPNLELVVLCVTLLIETSIRPDLTEMLRPYSQTCKVILFYIKTSLKSNYSTHFKPHFGVVLHAYQRCMSFSYPQSACEREN